MHPSSKSRVHDREPEAVVARAEAVDKTQLDADTGLSEVAQPHLDAAEFFGMVDKPQLKS